MGKITINQKQILDYKTNEAIRSLWVNLSNTDSETKVFTFTSVMGKEGKSLVAFQTACTVAATGKRCVYVNANLRAVQDVYGENGASETLVSYLQGETKLPIQETDKANLYMIEAGAPCGQAIELLSNEKYKEFIKNLRDEYDYVIIDTPAVGEVADAMLSATLSDGVVLVMERGMIPYEQAQKVKNQLEMNGCKLLGVVLNK